MKALQTHLEARAAGAGLEPSAFLFACPECRTPLERRSAGVLRCPAEGLSFDRVDGIWRFLTPERAAHFRQFLHDYETIRRAEGRGSSSPAYYRALPFEDLAGRFQQDWSVRARTYQTFIGRFLKPLEGTVSRPLTCLDLGAGNGWFAARIARRGHQVAAIDLLTNAHDGLGAFVHYEAAFTPIQAEFDRLPLADRQVDLAVFNASIHYSTDYRRTLAEALRVTRAGGAVAILDSPVYRRRSSGERMVSERQMRFERDFGCKSDAIPCENYLTFRRLAELGCDLNLKWTKVQPFYGWKWTLRPWKAALLRRREPARFLILIGRTPA